MQDFQLFFELGSETGKGCEIRSPFCLRADFRCSDGAVVVLGFAEALGYVGREDWQAEESAGGDGGGHDVVGVEGNGRDEAGCEAGGGGGRDLRPSRRRSC